MKKLIIFSSIIIVLIMAVILSFFSYVFTSEHRVDVFLRNHTANENLPYRMVLTGNISDSIIGDMERHGARALESGFESIMPSEHRDEILRVYNKINNSNVRYLQNYEALLNYYVIYRTRLFSFNGINLSDERLHNPTTGEAIGTSASWFVISFHPRESRSRNNPALIYILVQRMPFAATSDVLPVDISKDDFNIFYHSLVSDFLDFHQVRVYPYVAKNSARGKLRQHERSFRSN